MTRSKLLFAPVQSNMRFGCVRKFTDEELERKLRHRGLTSKDTIGKIIKYTKLHIEQEFLRYVLEDLDKCSRSPEGGYRFEVDANQQGVRAMIRLFPALAFVVQDNQGSKGCRCVFKSTK